MSRYVDEEELQERQEIACDLARYVDRYEDDVLLALRALKKRDRGD